MADHHSSLSIPSGASPEEAAAIAAAIDSHLQTVEESQESDGRDWHGRRWRFTGQMETIQGRTVRVPRRAPLSPWRAAGRTGRF